MLAYLLGLLVLAAWLARDAARTADRLARRARLLEENNGDH